ncbi:fused MFS/spermidine synthase, partial [Planctomycetota bacterium]
MTFSSPSSTSSASMRGTRFAVACLMGVYLLSGACSLMDEVVWTRLLKLIIGNTVYASSIVVSVFMGGLALGAFLMGRISDRIRQPLRLYAGIEMIITVTALLSPWVLHQTDLVYLIVCRHLQPSDAMLLLGHVVLTTLILLVPTVLMGSTLPLLGRVVSRVEDQVGPLVGRLYALNTLGAAAGCFVAGFILIKALGVMGTLWVAAGLNLCVALGGLSLHLLFGRTSLAVEVKAPVVPTLVSATRTQSHTWILVMVGCFLSGLVSIAYELMWMRSIVHSIGAFTFVFSAVLTVYLLGNVMGTAIGTVLVRQVRNPAAGFALLLFALGVCGVIYLPWLHYGTYTLLPKIDTAVQSSRLLGRIPWMQLGPMVQCLTLFTLPSIIMGMGFPLVLQAWVNRVHRIGWSTAAVYSLNTLGAVTGGLLTGFVLLPSWGLQTSIVTLGLITAWFACFAWIVFFRARMHPVLRTAPLVLGALFITLYAYRLPSDIFTHIVALNGLGEGYELVDYKEGLNTTVSLHRNRNTDALYLYTSGSRVAGNSRGYRGDQKLLGHWPVLLHPNCQRVLSVGFGSGESTTCQTQHEPPLEEIAVVEIAPEVVEFSLKHFTDLNLGDQHPDKVNIIFRDARHYLHLTEEKYDVIVSDCTSIRGVAENASLFTREYFESARDHLRPGGMFMSWIDAFSTEAKEVVNSIIGTLMDVYPHVTLWYPVTEPASFFVIVGSQTPQIFSPSHIDREMANERVLDSLRVIDINDTIDVLSCYIADEKDLRAYIDDYATNSDYHPIVEFSTDSWDPGTIPLHNFFQAVRVVIAATKSSWDTGPCCY